MTRGSHIGRARVVGAVVIAAAGLGACGSSKKSSSASSSTTTSNGTIALSISESGGKAQFTAPRSIKGGLVTVSLKNEGKQPHTAQFVLIRGNHTLADALKVLGSNSNKTPSWMRAEGGVGLTVPGQTGSTTVYLPAGKYGLVEIPGPGSNGPPASTQLEVAHGSTGSLPSTATKLTAATNGKDKYKWDVSGTLSPGTNHITFKSEGAKALHLISAVRITGNPSKSAIIKGLETNGKPPAFFDVTALAESAALDGGKTVTTDLSLPGPGRYVLFCPLTDRDGGKPHFAEGLLKTVTVK